MKVLYVVFKALLGGHVLSANTIAKEMMDSGVIPMFAGAEGVMTDEIRKKIPFTVVDIPVFHGSRQTYFTWKSFSAVSNLRRIIKSQKIELIHAFDARSYFHAYLAGLLEGVPVLCTLCGGIDPYYNLPSAPVIIVFSEEQKQKMVKEFGWSPENVEVVRTRLDLKQITSNDQLLTDDEAISFGLDPVLPKVMMISSFDGTKIRSIHKVLDSVETLFEKNKKFQMVMIGGKGALHEEAMLRGSKICQHFGAKRIVFTGPVIGAYKLLQRADIVLGVGRSAFEGMAYGRPTLIIGENGFAGAVCPEDVEAIAWYNFSGRNQYQDVSSNVLVEQIDALLSDEKRRLQLGKFAQKYVLSEIDVTQGAQRITDIYERMSAQNTQFQVWKNWGSFFKCLAPIAKDNGLHAPKQGVKHLLKRG